MQPRGSGSTIIQITRSRPAPELESGPDVVESVRGAAGGGSGTICHSELKSPACLNFGDNLILTIDYLPSNQMACTSFRSEKTEIY